MMEEPEWEQGSTGAHPVTEEVAVPLGPRLAMLFLWAVTVVLIFVILSLTLIVIPTLVSSALSADPYPKRVWGSLVAVVTVMTAVGMHSGTTWLSMQMESRWTGALPPHPGRGIVLPMVGIVVIAGIIAVLFWVPSIFIHDVSRTFPWPLIWSTVGIGAFFLYRYLDHILPK
ncbi:hypothetical protein [Luteolibacter soli]|uniref:Tripartite tricarboxylate transporter TctB family protein n=1 Tax=Luteolibacter soli TaxID=3135280 RepID=A0ABU9ARH6_9BACT